MWADKDSGNDDGYTGRRKKDYSKPINFVSGGIVQKGKDKKNTDDDDSSILPRYQLEFTYPDTGSIGSSASDKGTGSGRSSPVVKEKKLFKNTGIKKDASALGTQVFANKMHKTGKEFGSWEKYTKGFGMKMLQQMGYEPGKGLGKEGQGIVMPVEAFKRKGRGALGIYGPERSKKAQQVIHAWESEPYNTPQAGILKVPPQATVSEVENEARQGESIEKKKKKKKKKKTEEGAEKPKENSSKKRTQKPIEFDLGIMLQTISKSPAKNFEKPSKKIVVSTGVLHHDAKPVKSPYTKVENKIPHNMLDSTAPLVKRGKERETPARKKPSPLKKIILKEREEKKKARETTEADDIDKIVDDMDVVTSRANDNAKDVIPEEVQSPSEDDKIKLVNGEGFAPSHHEIAAKIHSRRFREYCSQVQDKEVDSVASELLKELVRFQDRQFHRDPIKAKAKRRFVLGLREVSKHLKLRKLKCVIISSNVERIKSEGGLDEALQGIIALCQENEVPVVYALKRQSLGKVLLKKVPVSIVGIFNYDGAEEYFKKLIDLTQRTKQAYTEKWEETRERLAVSLQLSGTKNTEFECKESAEVDVPNMITDVATENSDENGSRDDDSESENEDVITKNEESDLHVVIQDFKLLVTES